MDKESQGKWHERHGKAIATGGIFVAGLAGIAAVEGVRRLQGSATMQEIARKGAANPQVLLKEQLVTYKNGIIVRAVATLLIHPGFQEFGKIKEAMGLSRHQTSISLGFLSDNHLMRRARNEENRLQYVSLDPVVPLAVYTDPEAYRHFIAAATEMHPSFDVASLAPDANATGN